MFRHEIMIIFEIIVGVDREGSMFLDQMISREIYNESFSNTKWTPRKKFYSIQLKVVSSTIILGDYSICCEYDLGNDVHGIHNNKMWLSTF